MISTYKKNRLKKRRHFSNMFNFASFIRRERKTGRIVIGTDILAHESINLTSLYANYMVTPIIHIPIAIYHLRTRYPSASLSIAAGQVNDIDTRSLRIISTELSVPLVFITNHSGFRSETELSNLWQEDSLVTDMLAQARIGGDKCPRLRERCSECLGDKNLDSVRKNFQILT